MSQALLIIGHGSRSKDAVSVFNRIVDDVRKKGEFDCVEGAHMELATPSIETMVARLAERNIQSIVIVPYFLYEGIHLKEDIPAIFDKIMKEYPHITFTLARAIGYEPAMTDIILKRAHAVM
jgi:sirohydrochlorin ferrochelatase